LQIHADWEDGTMQGHRLWKEETLKAKLRNLGNRNRASSVTHGVQPLWKELGIRKRMGGVVEKGRGRDSLWLRRGGVRDLVKKVVAKGAGKKSRKKRHHASQYDNSGDRQRTDAGRKKVGGGSGWWGGRSFGKTPFKQAVIITGRACCQLNRERKGTIVVVGSSDTPLKWENIAGWGDSTVVV